jgi:hypothetical protein
LTVRSVQQRRIIASHAAAFRNNGARSPHRLFNGKLFNPENWNAPVGLALALFAAVAIECVTRLSLALQNLS